MTKTSIAGTPASGKLAYRIDEACRAIGIGRTSLYKLVETGELKLIRSLQSQVNMRTKMYGDKDKAEQSKDENVQKELRQLSARQQKLQEMIDKIASGENEK